jgi:hypothetical protein
MSREDFQQTIGICLPKKKINSKNILLKMGGERMRHAPTHRFSQQAGQLSLDTGSVAELVAIGNTLDCKPLGRWFVKRRQCPAAFNRLASEYWTSYRSCAASSADRGRRARASRALSLCNYPDPAQGFSNHSQATTTTTAGQLAHSSTLCYPLD